MAINHLIFPLTLLSLLIVIASAEYAPYTQTQNPDHVDYDLQQQPLDHNHHDHRKHDDRNDLLGSTLNLDVDDLLDNLIDGKQDPNEHDKQQGQGNFAPKDPSYEKITEPYYGHAQKGTYDQVHGGTYSNINYIAIQGHVLCELEPKKFYPLKGAVVEITCPTSYENGYNKDPYILRSETREKGFFAEKLTISELKGKSINLDECKAFLKYSPSETCNVPTYSASSGAHLSLLRAHTDKICYTVGDLIYTRNTHDYPARNSYPVPKDHPAQNGY